MIMLEKFKEAMAAFYADSLADINPYEEEKPDAASFYEEARAIVEGFIKAENRSKYSAADVIQPTFKVTRGKALSVNDCASAVEELLMIFECAEECIPFHMDEELKDKMVDGYVTPVMRVAEHFTVDSFSVGRKSYVYLNERIFKVIDKRKTLDLYKAILRDRDAVYIQYKRPLKNGLEGYFTKIVRKSKYDYSRLKKKENIVEIFDTEKKYNIE